MELLGTTIQWTLFALMLATPFLVMLYSYRATKEVGFVRANLISFSVCFVLAAILAYWPHFYAYIRLEFMGFDFDGMSDTERARNIAPHLREEATRLYWSNIGIGWPLKAIFGMLLIATYTSFVIGAIKLVSHIKRKAL